MPCWELRLHLGTLPRARIPACQVAAQTVPVCLACGNLEDPQPQASPGEGRGVHSEGQHSGPAPTPWRPALTWQAPWRCVRARRCCRCRAAWPAWGRASRRRRCRASCGSAPRPCSGGELGRPWSCWGVLPWRAKTLGQACWGVLACHRGATPAPWAAHTPTRRPSHASARPGMQHALALDHSRFTHARLTLDNHVFAGSGRCARRRQTRWRACATRSSQQRPQPVQLQLERSAAVSSTSNRGWRRCRASRQPLRQPWSSTSSMTASRRSGRQQRRCCSCCSACRACSRRSSGGRRSSCGPAGQQRETAQQQRYTRQPRVPMQRCEKLLLMVPRRLC